MVFLIEVLLVLALVGVLAGLVAGNAGAFIKGAQLATKQSFKKAILDAIYEGRNPRIPPMCLTTKTASFVVKNSTGASYVLPIYKDDLNEEFESPEVVFTAIGPGSGPSGELSSYNDDELILSRIPFIMEVRFLFLRRYIFERIQLTIRSLFWFV